MINLILFFLIINQSPYEYDPSLTWFTFETKRFSIHIPSSNGLNKEEENLAKKFAIACETADSLLSPFMQWQPKRKVNVIVADFFDYPQGWSFSFPHNTITVMPTHPASDLTNYDDWFLNLILHEYTHILQMDKIRGFPRFLRAIFGRVILPGGLTPLWMLEGFAVYNETKYTDFGRAGSPEYGMKMRTAVLTNRLLPIDKPTTYELRQYPGSEAPYLYGSQFYHYLADKLGDEKIADYLNYNSKCLPFFVNFAARRVFATTLNNLWWEWQNSIIKVSNQEAETIKLKPLTVPTKVTKIGFDMYAPQFSKYGEKIYFVSYTPHELPAIKSLDLITKETKTLVKGYIGKTLSLSSDGGVLLFSKRNVIKNYYEYDDIFAYNLTTEDLYRITKNMRARDPEFSPDNEKIVFVENSLGKNRLLLLDRKTNLVETLVEEDDYTQFAQPKFSPDGKKIAIAIWKPEGYQDVLVIDLEAGWRLPITYDRATDIQPAWAPDGKYVVFSSDRTGVFNLYAYILENRQIYQVTNVLTGAIAPNVSPDGKRIAFLGYSERGWDINFINVKPSTWEKANIIAETIPASSDTAQDIRTILSPYSTFSSIFPKFWLPLVWYDTTFSFGFFTAGADVLLHNIFILTANYQIKENNPYIYLGYLSQKYPFSFYGFYEKNEQGGGISGYIPFYSTFSYHLFLPYYEFSRNDTRIKSGLGLEWQTGNAKKYPYSISPVDGRGFWFDVSHFNRYLGSTNNLTKVKASYSEYLGLPIRHHVLAGRLNTATGFGDSIVKNQYQLGGDAGMFSIRGYDQESLPNQNVIKATLEYRFPLFWVERGLSTAPFFLSNFSGAIGVDGGLAWDDYKIPSLKFLSDNSKLGAFVELHASLVIAYFVPVTLKVGYGHGLINNGIGQVYINAGTSLINLLNEKKRLNRKDINKLLFK